MVAATRTFVQSTVLGLAALAVVATGPAVGDDDMQRCFGTENADRIEACTMLLEQPLSRMEKSLAYAMRALAYSIRGDYTSALPDYDRAIELRPDFAIALNNRAWALYKSGDVQGAALDVERSLSLSPMSAHTLDTRGHIRQSKGDVEGALKDYRAAMQFGGSHMVRLYQCGLQTTGHYVGPLSGILTPQFQAALETCVRQPSCDPLPPDEECRKLTS